MQQFFIFKDKDNKDRLTIYGVIRGMRFAQNFPKEKLDFVKGMMMNTYYLISQLKEEQCNSDFYKSLITYDKNGDYGCTKYKSLNGNFDLVKDKIEFIEKNEIYDHTRN